MSCRRGVGMQSAVSRGWENHGVPVPFDPPVVLAPMAGITNRAFRSLARESAHAVVGSRGVGMYVSEMVTSRALVERSAESLDLVTFGPDEDPACGPALRRRPGHRGGRRPDAGRRGPGRPHRPELRLPRAQGHPQGRRQRAALEARPVPEHRARRHRRRRRSCPRVGQDAQGHRRRPPHLPRRRPGRRRGGRRVGCPARADRGPDVRGHRRLGRHRPPQGGARPPGHPGARATETSGRRRTRCAWWS